MKQDNHPVISPLTGNSNVRKIKGIPVGKLKQAYQENFGISIDRFIASIDEVELYECVESGLGFYTPESVCGDGEFYAQLQRTPWYYMDEKWEYVDAIRRISRGDRVLELGSGKGGFLTKLRSAGIKAIGLELNQDAATEAGKRGLDVRCEDILAHSEHNKGAYDIVCSFQVMEHVAQPRAILESSVRCLRQGGMLIVAVPDNGGFLKVERDPVLNAPPHHLLRWNRSSLEFLQKIFPLQLKDIVHEPLQPQHYNYFLGMLADTSAVRHSWLKRRAFNWLRGDLVQGVGQMAEGIHGHTVIAYFTKI